MGSGRVSETLAVSDRSAKWKSAPLFCAFFTVLSLSSQILALLHSAEDRFSCQINHRIRQESYW
jgi:hypothetical protein